MNDFTRCQVSITFPDCVDDSRFFSQIPKDNITVVIGIAESPLWLWLHLQIRKMTEGEVKSVQAPHSETVTADIVYNATTVVSKAQEDAPSTYKEENCGQSIPVTISLSSVEPSKEVYQLTQQEKLERAATLKECGSKAYMNKHTSIAFQLYSKALKYTILAEPCAELESDLLALYKTLKTQCYFNMAACQINSSNFSAVVENCTKGLDLDCDNVKGLYRRSVAYCKLSQYEEAVADLEKAAEIEPENTVVSKQLSLAKQYKTKQLASMATAMKKIFS